MTPRQHANEIAKDAAKRILIKYNAGQKEHGGMLWTKPRIIDMAIEEAIDQVIYLLTLKSQLDHPEIINPLAVDK
jgi:hypothetical protein